MLPDEQGIFDVITPNTPCVPIIASIPHSGLYVPPFIDKQFTALHRLWLRNTDWFIPAVFDFLPALGITTIVATHSRYVVDLNRAPTPPLFGPFGKSPVAERLLCGQQTHTTAPTEAELQQRIRLYHTPYHEKLSVLATTIKQQFGRCLIVDLHAFMGPSTYDICLGNLHGQSCRGQTMDLFNRALCRQGFDTSINTPFAGQYMLQRHSSGGQEALQLELRYTNYMDCAHIDEPGRPTLSESLLQTLRPRLIQAFCDVIDRY